MEREYPPVSDVVRNYFQMVAPRYEEQPQVVTPPVTSKTTDDLWDELGDFA